MSLELLDQFIIADAKLFLNKDKQLSLEFLWQCNILLFGKKSLIKPSHLKFWGALSDTNLVLKLCRFNKEK